MVDMDHLVIWDTSNPRKLGLTEWKRGLHRSSWTPKGRDIPFAVGEAMPYIDQSDPCPTAGNMKGVSEQGSRLLPSTMTHPTCSLWQVVPLSFSTKNKSYIHQDCNTGTELFSYRNVKEARVNKNTTTQKWAEWLSDTNDHISNLLSLISNLYSKSFYT